MSAAVQAFYRNYDLPWMALPEDRVRLRRSVRRVGIPLLILSLLMPWLPGVDRSAREIMPPPDRIARLIIEKPLPPPPVVAPKPVEKPTLLEKILPEPKPKLKPKPQPKVEPRVEPQVDTKVAAQERAKGAGVLAMADELAALRDMPALTNLNKVSSDTGGSIQTTSTRSILTKRTGNGSSGGINTAALSRGTGGAGLVDTGVTQVSSPVEAATSTASRSSAATESRLASRSREEIEMIFDQNKSAIYSIYNRALREDPTLEGKLVLRLTIAPSGQVTQCEIVSSELKAPDLEAKLVSRVKLFNFGAKDVDTVVTTKPIDFFPA